MPSQIAFVFSIKKVFLR